MVTSMKFLQDMPARERRSSLDLEASDVIRRPAWDCRPSNIHHSLELQINIPKYTLSNTHFLPCLTMSRSLLLRLLPLARISNALRRVLAGLLDAARDVGDAIAERLGHVTRRTVDRVTEPLASGADDPADHRRRAAERVAQC